MKLLYLNNDGGGFADEIEVPDGMSAEALFEKLMPEKRREDYLIRVNHEQVPAKFQLSDGDRLTITPTKIHGAGRPLNSRRTSDGAERRCIDEARAAG